MSDDGSVSSLFPRRSAVSIGRDDARVVSIDGEADEAVFDALGSATARRILAETYDEPAPASEIAERVDTSLQNARYHLDNLADAGLVEQVDTWYSEKGNEMVVWGRPAGGLVLVAGGESWRGRVERALKRLLAPVAALALASVGVQRWLARQGDRSRVTMSSDDAASEGTAETVNTTADTLYTGAETAVHTFDPGLVFLAGGAFALLVFGVWRYYLSSR
jgi:DNA-binding transcriptional ArsR family regulator